MIAVVSLVNPKSVIRGMLRNMFLEVQPNLFVGQMGAKQVAQIVEILKEHGATGVLVVDSSKHGFGIRVKQLGIADRQIIEFDGMQFVQRNQ